MVGSEVDMVSGDTATAGVTEHLARGADSLAQSVENAKHSDVTTKMRKVNSGSATFVADMAR